MAQEPNKTEPKAIGGELIIPVAAIAFTLYYIASIFDSPWEAQVNAFFVGSLLIALSLLFIIISVRSIFRGEACWGLGRVIAPARLVPRRLLLLALTLGYIAALEWAGFTLCTFILLLAAMLLLNDARRPWLALGLSAGLALLAYFLFIVAFETRFPRGPIEHFLQGML